MRPCTDSGSASSLVAALREHADELLRVERVSTGALEQLRPNVGGDDRPLDEIVHEACRLLVGERCDRECRRVCLSSRPGRARVEELRPRDAGDEHRARVADESGEVLQEIELHCPAPSGCP